MEEWELAAAKYDSGWRPKAEVVVVVVVHLHLLILLRHQTSHSSSIFSFTAFLY